MKTVVITGVAGFLGGHVARQFAQNGWGVIGVDVVAPENARIGTQCRYVQLSLPSAELAQLLKESRPDACVHCAGRASVGLSIEDPAADFRGNTLLTFELLDALRRSAPRCRFLLLSSAAVYGNPQSLPVGEDQPVAPLSPYGFHKHQAELLVQEFAKIYGQPGLSVRIFSAYGPGLRRQVIWDICERILTTGTLTLGGTGEETRDFIHAADVAGALALLADRAPATGEIYNLATGRETSIAELAQLLAAALGRNVRPTFDGRSRPGDPRNWRADISKLQALGYRPALSLESGLAQIAQWASAELAGIPQKS
jgi:UDP-glucose 4-epimerase